MKKILLFILFLTISFILFSEKIEQSYGGYNYYNSNGSLDWDTFFKDWEKSKMVYKYVFLNYRYAYNNPNSEPTNLYYYREKNNGDDCFSYYNSNTKIVISVIFSNVNRSEYSKHTLFNIKTEYNKFIQLWNHYMNN